jgi:hypothetical protein
MALELFIQLLYQRRQGAVVPAKAQGVRQLAAVAVQLGVKILHGPADHLPAQQLGLVVVQHPEVRRQGPAILLPGQEMGVLPQQPGAKGVHRLDVRPVDPQQLAAQVVVPRITGQPVGQLGGDAPPQLRCRRLGIGDD